MEKIRVLVVDDYEPWRRFLVSALRERPELEVVGEVSDGLEALRKCQELRPNLILLDIGIPKLDGLKVARRLRAVCQESKILFVSQESSADVVSEALSTGAYGYIVKTNANNLLTAVDAAVAHKPSSAQHLTP